MNIFISLWLVVIALWVVIEIGKRYDWWISLCLEMVRSENGGMDAVEKILTMFTVTGLITPDQVNMVRDQFSITE